MRNHRKDGSFRKGHKAAQIGPEPADAVVNIRVPRDTKGRWVRAAGNRGRKLSAWVRETLDKESEGA